MRPGAACPQEAECLGMSLHEIVETMVTESTCYERTLAPIARMIAGTG